MKLKTLFLFTFFFKLNYSQINLDSLRFEKLIISDTQFLKQQLDDSLVYIHSNGLIETKPSFIESVTSGKIIYQKYEILNHNSIQEKNTKINTGEINVEGLFDLNSFTVKLKYVSIYIRKNKQWKLKYWQSTKIK